MQHRTAGFTLIELVIVIVILGILAAAALPRFSDLSGDARIAALNGLAGSIRSAGALAKATTGGQGPCVEHRRSLEGVTIKMTQTAYPTGGNYQPRRSPTPPASRRPVRACAHTPLLGGLVVRSVIGRTGTTWPATAASHRWSAASFTKPPCIGRWLLGFVTLAWGPAPFISTGNLLVDELPPLGFWLHWLMPTGQILAHHNYCSRRDRPALVVAPGLYQVLCSHWRHRRFFSTLPYPSRVLNLIALPIADFSAPIRTDSQQGLSCSAQFLPDIGLGILLTKGRGGIVSLYRHSSLLAVLEWTAYP